MNTTDPLDLNLINPDKLAAMNARTHTTNTTQTRHARHAHTMAWFIPTWTKLDAAHPAFLQPAGDEDEGERTGVRRARTGDSTPCWQLVRSILAARGRSDDQESPGVDGISFTVHPGR